MFEAFVRQRIEAAGASLLFLPPYSPDLNPIELAFSKIKQMFRSLRCRVHGQLWDTMQQVLDKVTTADATGFFNHCGYTLEIK